jgi:ribosomal protein S18 acetylase RimI-like enzyme
VSAAAALATGAFGIRPAGPDDLGFVREMLYEAAFWRSDARRPDLSARPLDVPELAVYVDGWGRTGDRALIACQADRPLGAAWFRLFTEHAHGYGFVEPGTPELCVAVVAAYRGRGIGSALLAVAMAQASLDGFGRLSLSVEPDNPAARLYARLGFQAVSTGTGSLTMVAATSR